MRKFYVTSRYLLLSRVNLHYTRQWKDDYKKMIVLKKEVQVMTICSEGRRGRSFVFAKCQPEPEVGHASAISRELVSLKMGSTSFQMSVFFSEKKSRCCKKKSRDSRYLDGPPSDVFLLHMTNSSRPFIVIHCVIYTVISSLLQG